MNPGKRIQQLEEALHAERDKGEINERNHWHAVRRAQRLAERVDELEGILQEVAENYLGTVTLRRGVVNLKTILACTNEANTLRPSSTGSLPQATSTEPLKPASA